MISLAWEVGRRTSERRDAKFAFARSRQDRSGTVRLPFFRKAFILFASPTELDASWNFNGIRLQTCVTRCLKTKGFFAASQTRKRASRQRRPQRIIIRPSP